MESYPRITGISGKTLGSETIIRNIIGGGNSGQMIFTNKNKIGKTHKRQN